jgi:S-adenosylmethionine decarboxylase
LSQSVVTGTEWVIDAHGCDPSALRSPEVLQALFDRIVREVGLQIAAPAVWKVFPGEGGVTGLLLLSESHLTCHTFPERGFAALNLYCCRPRESWPWADRLRETLGATGVEVRALARS